MTNPITSTTNTAIPTNPPKIQQQQNQELNGRVNQAARPVFAHRPMINYAELMKQIKAQKTPYTPREPSYRNFSAGQRAYLERERKGQSQPYSHRFPSNRNKAKRAK